MRTILVDNYDSYSYNLFQLMASIFGVEPTVLLNDSPRWADIDLADCDAVVISPGPGRPDTYRDRGVALDHVRDGSIPVLGVCLGHQALGWFAGAQIVPAPHPRHGHLDRISHLGTDLFRGLPQDFVAVRYHSLCVAEPLPPDTVATAWSQDGVIMALRHERMPWWGVQFHPESVATEYGAALLSNFRDIVHEYRNRDHASAVKPRRAAPHRSVLKADLDFVVPVERVFTELFGSREHAFWLDSSRVEKGLSRFSFLGDAGGDCGEVLLATAGSGKVEVQCAGGDLVELDGSIFRVLEERIRDGAARWDSSLPFDLVSGYVGYFGYELKSECGSTNRHVSQQPDAAWMTASRLVAVDHETGRSWVLALTNGERPTTEAAQQWIKETVAALRRLRDRELAPDPVLALGEDRQPVVEQWLDRPRTRYLDDVRECQRALCAGESYEICLTNTVDMPFSGSPLELYRRLRSRNPAPYSAYVRFGDLHILCSSPERFIKIDPQRTVESKPIKGTARRDSDPVRDAGLRDELAVDPKARAENLMIVDLLRNDLGRICEIDSISVPRYMHVESYATVHQLVSTIRGRLRDEIGPVAAVQASFPGGSMTGAPKLRTMEIIDSLENRARGIYSGALGFFGFQGAADLNIVIRTAVISGDRITIGAGGAIVLDSDPDSEFDEMVMKASSVAQAIVASDLTISARRRM